MNRIESWTEKVVRLALARAGNNATGRAVELIEMGKPESHPEIVTQMAIGNALRDAAAAIQHAIQTGVLPDGHAFPSTSNPYPEVNDELAPDSDPRTG